ncbi:hypothetical protein E2562_012396 [Oryza meyeriana var. granulata]|uniref:Uncharacterized protein n=1 Tax=Oryza meyeriana var. granulata TaxID=110450 RepID=A0A6G1C3Y0_9ORYZ|nr:hypothetical protein E2562_012396 [Oryza meyeriana var. granulata]
MLALTFHDKIALIFSSSKAVIDAVDNISVLLAVTILLNGVRPVLSGNLGWNDSWHCNTDSNSGTYDRAV